MKRPWSRRLASVGRTRARRRRPRAQSASAATQFAARIATSIVQAQLGPSSTGFARDPGRRAGRRARRGSGARRSDAVRGCEQRQVLAARQLPRHLDVRPVAVRRSAAARCGASGQRRPVLKSRVPVDLGPEVCRARSRAGRSGARQIASARAIAQLVGVRVRARCSKRATVGSAREHVPAQRLDRIGAPERARELDPGATREPVSLAVARRARRRARRARATRRAACVPRLHRRRSCATTSRGARAHRQASGRARRPSSRARR